MKKMMYICIILGIYQSLSATNTIYVGSNETRTNENTMEIINAEGIYVMGNNAKGINGKNGIINLNGNYGIQVLMNGEGANKGIINITNGEGMYGDGETTILTNERDGVINLNRGIYGMYSYEGVIKNYGEINVHDKIGIMLEIGKGENYGVINVTNGVGVKTNNSNFYNSGKINALGQKAIEMDYNDSILELGAGTFLRGRTNGLSGEDTLVLSGIGTVDVGNGSVYNFEKLVVTGDIIAKGTYNLGISNGSNYQSSAFGNITSYDINDASEASGNLIVDGAINIGVDYDGIDKDGTDKTGKIIANKISKTSNGHIVLENKGVTASNIIDEAKKSDAKISEFRIKGLATIKDAQTLDPELFETKDLFEAKDGWKTMVVGDRTGVNGSILLDQKYYKSDESSKILIPRNRVDLDSMETLNKIKNNLVLSNNLDLNIGEDVFTADYLGTKGKSRFMGSKSYNYDYDVNTDGVAFTYMYKANKKLSLGTAFSYEKNEVKYNGVRIGNVNVVAPSQNHKEIIDSYNAELFTKYENNNLNIVLDLGYGLSNHKAKTNFVSGIKDGKYDSHILKAGIQGSYNFDLENNLTDETKLVPTIGLEYVNVFEESYRYKDSVKLESTNGDGYIGTLGLQLKNRKDKISWNYGVTYKYNSEDTFHNKRKVSGYDLEIEKLDYSRKTLSFNFDTEYSVTEDFSLRAGYEYEKNDNYRNNNINLGFTYKF